MEAFLAAGKVGSRTRDCRIHISFLKAWVSEVNGRECIHWNPKGQGGEVGFFAGPFTGQAFPVHLLCAGHWRIHRSSFTHSVPIRYSLTTRMGLLTASLGQAIYWGVEGH